MEGSAAGEEFDHFFAAVNRRLVAQAYLLTGDLGDAEDLAQEALMRAWRSWGRVSRLDNQEAWVRRVLGNLVVSRWRRRRTTRRNEARLLPLAPPALDERQFELVKALGGLPLPQQRAIVLHAVAGFGVEEIAEDMDASPGTVRVWLSRARRSLAESLDTDNRERLRGGGPGECLR